MAIEIKPDFAEAHNNLGNILKNLGKIDAAEASYRRAIELKPDFAEAHNNIGNLFHDLGKLEYAEKSYREAISIFPEYYEAINNLGANLRDLGKLNEAELLCRKAITLNPKYSMAYRNLGIILFTNGDITSAIDIVEKGFEINPKSKNIKFLLAILKSRLTRSSSSKTPGSFHESSSFVKLSSNPLILNRPVEPDLITSIYELKALELDNKIDPTFGDTKGSDYRLFEENHSILNIVEEDLVRIIKQATNSDIYIEDSFFTIYGIGGWRH
jgi:tetratricopeptide (TPR) repeat protein